jgi:3-methyladenine DNA glycosylase AlkD
LNRAAIQHQRGWKQDTDIPFVLSICDVHSGEREFFVAKAIGWALRDIARLDARAVRNFLKTHPELSTVAVREAQRGLQT